MQKLKQIKQLIFIIVLGLTIVNPVLVFAQANTNTGTTTPSSANTGVPVYQNVQQSVSNFLCTPSEPADGHDLERCINKLYRFGVAFGAVALVFFVVLAGYIYITGGETGKSRAKGILQNALVGMGLLLGSYVLLSFINPDLVVFKPIQPPIFSAPDIPACDKVGLGEDCILPGGGIGVGNGSGGATAYAPCPGENLVDVTGVRTDGGVGKICKTLLDKLVALKTATSNIPWLATSAVDGTHLSKCHSSGNAVSGVCVDLALDGGRLPSYTKENGSTNPKWGDLCRAVQGLGGVAIANEAGKISPCPTYKSYDTTTGPNLHIYLSQ